MLVIDLLGPSLEDLFNRVACGEIGDLALAINTHRTDLRTASIGRRQSASTTQAPDSIALERIEVNSFERKEKVRTH